MEFKCYESTYLDEYGPWFEMADSDVGESTNKLSEAQVFLSGSIKWDGCSNMNFDAQENCMLHFCGRSDAAKVGKLLDRLYDLADEHIPIYDSELGNS
jgi:hypothetical protein